MQAASPAREPKRFSLSHRQKPASERLLPCLLAALRWGAAFLPLPESWRRAPHLWQAPRNRCLAGGEAQTPFSWGSVGPAQIQLAGCPLGTQCPAFDWSSTKSLPVAVSCGRGSLHRGANTPALLWRELAPSQRNSMKIPAWEDIKVTCLF